VDVAITIHLREHRVVHVDAAVDHSDHDALAAGGEPARNRDAAPHLVGTEELGSPVGGRRPGPVDLDRNDLGQSGNRLGLGGGEQETRSVARNSVPVDDLDLTTEQRTDGFQRLILPIVDLSEQ
jgi:hypothetical protein